MNWYALYTKPRHEDLVADRLHTLGIETLNLKLKRYSSTAIHEHAEPFFPCYLFAKFDESKYAHLITYSRGVKYIVGRDQPIVVCDEIIAQFDRKAPQYYSDQDRQNGYISSMSRQGVEMKFPLMTISIAVVTNLQRKFSSPLEISAVAVELKEYAKTFPRSLCVVDKRRS